VTTILWDYKSAYYSWEILASTGAYVSANTGSDFDLKNVSVATPGAVKALSTIAALVRSGLLPKINDY
jgi:maltose-binding protein MalE